MKVFFILCLTFGGLMAYTRWGQTQDHCLVLMMTKESSLMAFDQPVVRLDFSSSETEKTLERVSGYTDCVLIITDSLASTTNMERALQLFTFKEIISVDGSREAHRDQEFSFPVSVITEIDDDKYLKTITCPTGEVVKIDVEMQVPLQLSRSLCPHELTSAHLNVSFNGLAPYIVTATPDSVQGVDVDTLNILADRFKFSYKLIRLKAWLSKSPDGKFGGIVGQVYHGFTQMGIGHVHMVKPHMDLVDFCALLYTIPVKIFSPKLEPLASYKNFLKPFTTQVWVTMLGFLLLICLLYLFIFYFQLENLTIKLFIWYRCLVSQTSSLSRLPRTLTQFIMALTLLFFAFFILHSYECNLRAYLMSVDFEEPLDTEEDILRLQRRFYVPRNTFFLPYFKFSPHPVQQALGRDIERRDLQFYYVQGLRPVELERDIIANKDAFPWSREMGLAASPQMIARHGHQPWRIGKKTISNTFNGMVTPKHTPWASDMLLVTERLKDGGIINHLIRKYLKQRFLAEDRMKMTAKPEAFRMDHIIGMLFIWISGLSIALLSFVFECFFRYLCFQE